MSKALKEYVAAVERERMLRSAAFVLPTERIGEFEALPMTLRHYTALRLINSAMFSRVVPTVEDVDAFLWVLHPQHGNPEARRQLSRRLRWYHVPREPRLHLPFLMRRWSRKAAIRAERLAELLREIGVYIDEAWQDWPASKGEEGPSYFSDDAAICHECGAAYGWSMEETMDAPIKVLFQMLKIIRAEHRVKAGQYPVMFNPSDRLKAEAFN